ncbi:TlyA family RNA methyltransferase [Pandoraea apista]|uniref:TlyA family RNA methyltransferase n=1 Tax=Pandoraea apista TaxID=93218 RepID=A0ABX9ZU96_9BURK|nr:TlyA family RNA methyltransferase [Pandoraea apista]PTE02421.1 TlyA family rRNA (cytidine-2'-O)-methyltransferase [Pandoraea apista]RRJ33351.1 TlyA family RNA methyltransferase [Pandoraea apista]RRJ82079.1 TlyA family RNA methyltransferase [Pandoraea apista]RSD15707.1 TlyA family RNA methyltransferase [Pandoraea apista]RSD24715.1 TlyA family RNA methyltransferase [Pandoraea apista]
MSQALRADQALVSRGLAASRTAAQRLIDAGRVYFAGTETALKKASQVVADDEDLEVRAAADGLPGEDRYVSRGGLKLAGALAQTGLDVTGRIALDVGLSTGGFADCLLQAGVAQVVGVDVGHGQLNQRLATEPRLVSLEGINARHLSREMLDERLTQCTDDAARDTPVAALTAVPEAGFDLIVGDVSFISLTLILPALAPLLAATGDLLMLVKPQFEVGREHIGRGGLVKDAAQYAQVETKIRTACEALALTVAAWLDSPIAGGDGNREFFVHARRAA